MPEHSLIRVYYVCPSRAPNVWQSKIAWGHISACTFDHCPSLYLHLTTKFFSILSSTPPSYNRTRQGTIITWSSYVNTRGSADRNSSSAVPISCNDVDATTCGCSASHLWIASTVTEVTLPISLQRAIHAKTWGARNSPSLASVYLVRKKNRKSSTRRGCRKWRTA